MKKNFLTLAAVLGIAVFSACSNDLDDCPNVNNYSNIDSHTAHISDVNIFETPSVSRATEVNSWASAATKDIGVSIYKTTSGSELLRTDTKNTKWSYNTSSSSWDAASIVNIFHGENGYVSAYYPYSSSVTNPASIKIDNSVDWMYAPLSDAKSVSYNSPTTSISMRHVNSQITVNMIRNGYAGTGKVTSFTLSGQNFASQATLNSLNGQLSNHGLMDEMTGSTGTLPYSQVQLQTIQKWFVPKDDKAYDITFDAVIDGIAIQCITSIKFEKGYKYTFNLSVTDDLQAEMAIASIDITPWTEMNKTETFERVISLKEKLYEILSNIGYATMNLQAVAGECHNRGLDYDTDITGVFFYDISNFVNKNDLPTALEKAWNYYLACTEMEETENPAPHSSWDAYQMYLGVLDAVYDIKTLALDKYNGTMTTAEINAVFDEVIDNAPHRK